MQVYRGMDIGTAKPSEAEQRILPHYLIDIRNPDQQFSAADFVQEADSICSDFYARGCLPVICGGTGFYIRNFILGLPDTPVSNPRLRQSLKAECELRGKEFMWQKLKAVDAESAAKINSGDSYRVLRALEIFELTGKPRSAFSGGTSLRNLYDFTTIILERPRDDLYRRIETRVDKMFDAGLEEEAGALMKTYSKDDPGMQAIGYREFFETDKNGNPLATEEVRARIKHDSKRYAKKQYVFMRGIPGAEIIQLDDNFSSSYIDKILQKMHNIVRIDTNF